MLILAIETSCDDTCAAVLQNDWVLSNVISSQINLHKDWGGVVPDIAKRAHKERIGPVVAEALKRAKKTIEEIEVVAVTKGPGLAPALGVGIDFAKKLAKDYHKKLIAINHIEGHILANLAKNRLGKPERKIEYPALALTVSGGHTKIVLVNKIGEYMVVGETLDDAAGEALDKAAKLLGLGYPGGPVIEKLALKGDEKFLELPKPLADKKILDYSFSGLKTSFYYKIKDWPKEKINSNLTNLAASFQEAVFETLIRKYKLASEKYRPKTLLTGGGVLANLTLRKKLRKLATELKLPILMPVKKTLNTDNAAMIGLAAYFRALKGEEIKEIDLLEREARYELADSMVK